MIIFIKNISKPKWKQRVTYCDTSAPRPCFFLSRVLVHAKSPFITNFKNTQLATQMQQITVSSPAVRRHTEYSHQSSAPQGRGYYTQSQIECRCLIGERGIWDNTRGGLIKELLAVWQERHRLCGLTGNEKAAEWFAFRFFLHLMFDSVEINIELTLLRYL